MYILTCFLSKKMSNLLIFAILTFILVAVVFSIFHQCYNENTCVFKKRNREVLLPVYGTFENQDFDLERDV
jgi:hypothetical protein